MVPFPAFFPLFRLGIRSAADAPDTLPLPDTLPYPGGYGRRAANNIYMLG